MLNKFIMADLIICIIQYVGTTIAFYVYNKFGHDFFILRIFVLTAKDSYILFLNPPMFFIVYYIYLVVKNYSRIMYLLFAVINFVILYIMCHFIFLNAADRIVRFLTRTGLDM
jgi:hypothetical protein